jgi:UDP-N-acetylglucosamine 2-epimerase (non-hydrolysing)
VKILTILGTRPELIRLSRIVPKLDQAEDHVVVHTGQNFDHSLDGIFFEQLGLRKPDHHLNARGTFGEQIARILSGMETILNAEKPDKFLVLGDTNSSLAAVMAKRAGVPVYHMEAGNRCYDDRVPEEVNRRIIDHSSDVLLPYTERSRQNLLREGISSERIYVTGNPIWEVIRHHEPQIAASSVLRHLGVAAGEYLLVTLHRAENVDLPERLSGFLRAFGMLADRHGLPVIVSTHPRTRQRLDAAGATGASASVRFLEPFGFFDFVRLERDAACVLSDSGTVQEECALLGVPNVTLRDVTERPETLECGSNLLSGADPASILACAAAAMARRGGWPAPREYLAENVSDTVAGIVLGYLRRGTAAR